MSIDYAGLLARFDDLVARRIINYAPRKTVRLEHHGFMLEFRICDSLLTKPESGEALITPSQTPVMCFGPGSDIANDDPRAFITTICNTHLLIINKFCVFRPQLLLLTSDSYRRQWEPLALEDFAAACTVLDSIGPLLPHFALYNCSPTAGSSREHKHVQILPRPPHLFPDDSNFDARVIPYRYFLRYLSDVDFGSPDGHTTLFKIYKELLAEAEKSLGDQLLFEDCKGGHYFPHNVALVSEWIILIPRRSNNFEGVTANAAGMMGSVWLMNEAQLDRWKQVGPGRVLSGLGVPKDLQAVAGD